MAASFCNCKTLCAYFFVLVLCASVTLAAPYASQSDDDEFVNKIKKAFFKRQPLYNCDSDRDVALICYQCAKSYPEFFSEVHAKCCFGESSEVREHCDSLYTEPPKRGILWGPSY